MDPAHLQHNRRMTALEGIRVLDLSRVLAGPWCTQTLADLGADVIKVERPGRGDDTRAWGPPFLRDAQGRESGESAYFLGANRNKRSMTCDIATPEGQALIRALVPHCHVLIENFKVGDMARYGLDWPTLRAIHPALVYCSITGYGQDGPDRHRAGYDFAIQGRGGLMSVTGERDDATDADGRPMAGGPQKVGVAVADLFTGMYATAAILAALRHAERTGCGQHVDMALLDCQVAMLANLGANHLVGGVVPGRMGNAHMNIVPYQVFAASDGHLIVAAGNDAQFRRLCHVIGEPALADDLRFASNADRVRERAVLVPLLAAALRRRPRAQWLAALDAAQVPCGPINDLGEVFADPQVQARQLVRRWQHPLCDELRLVASPIRLSVTPVVERRPPPLLGEHTAQVLGELLDLDAAAIAALGDRGVI